MNQQQTEINDTTVVGKNNITKLSVSPNPLTNDIKTFQVNNNIIGEIEVIIGK